MSITLHQAAEDLRALLDGIDPESGELPADFEPARAIVAAKATAVAAYILQAEREADMASAYVKELQQRIKSQQKRAEWLRTYLREHMSACGITKITDDRGIYSATLAVGRDKSVDVFDAAQLPQDYMREIPAKYEPDKTLIAKAIGDGFDVPGARIVARDRLTIK